MAKGMFVYSGKMFELRIDGKFTETLEKAIETMMRQAARAWLRAVIVKVAVWTGFALGSIKFARGNGGDLARFLNVAVPITRAGGLKRTPRWYYSPSGERTEKRPENAGRYAQFSFTSGRHIFTFRFRDDVVHFMLNNFYDSVSPTSPWNAIAAGHEAFKEYIKENIHKLPKIGRYIIKEPSVRFLGGADSV